LKQTFFPVTNRERVLLASQIGNLRRILSDQPAYGSQYHVARAGEETFGTAQRTKYFEEIEHEEIHDLLDKAKQTRKV
jgi:hypothetical protein